MEVPIHPSFFEVFVRTIVLDTETTGFTPGVDRIVECAAVVLDAQHRPTDEIFHSYFNPGRPVGDSERVHGLSDGFLQQHGASFGASVDAFLTFVRGSRLVIHNADFDLKMLQAELIQCGRAQSLQSQLGGVVDTLRMPSRVMPDYRGKKSLDALADHFGVDRSARVRENRHGALMDALILADVYAALEKLAPVAADDIDADTPRRSLIRLPSEAVRRLPVWGVAEPAPGGGVSRRP